MKTRESYQKKSIQESQKLVLPISCLHFMAKSRLWTLRICLMTIQPHAQPYTSINKGTGGPGLHKSYRGRWLDGRWLFPVKKLFSEETSQSMTHVSRALAPSCQSVHTAPLNSKRPSRWPPPPRIHMRTQHVLSPCSRDARRDYLNHLCASFSYVSCTCPFCCVVMVCLLG